MGASTYHHQMLVGSIVSPNQKQVFPILYEPISKQDGIVKNDYERNAAKRCLKRFIELYPHMPVTIVEDGLASNFPHIKALKAAKCHFILGAKADDHKFLYDWFEAGKEPAAFEFEEKIGHFSRRYKFMNNVPLNDSHFDERVNVVFLEETEEPYITKRGKASRKKLRHTKWM